MRDFSSDKYDNRELAVRKVLAHSQNYDNLLLLGYSSSFNSNAKFTPIFDQAYTAKVVSVIKEFEPEAEIHSVCNTLCLNVGAQHSVKTVLQLRALLSDLNAKENVVVVSTLTHLWNDDTQRKLTGDDLAKVFSINKHLEVNALRKDNFMAIQFWIEPSSIYDQTYFVNTRIMLHRVYNLNKQTKVLDVADRLKLRAK
jgi:hypothetical protein